MRVITGAARGMSLKTLSGDDVRPTASRVKEALFSIIQFEIEGRRVLDLFAGSGQLGIEALSRGAASAVFVDASKESLRVVRENLNHTKLDYAAVLRQSDAIGYLKTCGDVFDIVFVDPPYASGLAEKSLELIDNVVSPGGVVLCETALEVQLPEEQGALKLQKTYKYGKTRISFYRKEADLL